MATTSQYENWSDHVQRLADRQYVQLRDIVKTLDEMDIKNWSLVEHRQQALDIWGALERAWIFAQDSRIPAYKSFLDLSTSDYPKVVAQLVKSLSYKEASKHRNEPEKKPESSASRSQVRVAADTGHTEGVVVSYSSDDDARVAYYEALRTIRTQISRDVGVINRDSFEKKYGLVWVEKKA